MRLHYLAAFVMTAIAFVPLAATAQSPAANPDTSLVGRKVRIATLPGRSLPPQLSGTLVSLTADSIALKADSVQVITAPDDSTRMVRLPCGACIESRLSLADLTRAEVATPVAPDRWKKTRRRGVIWGALGSGALLAGVQATRSGDGVVTAGLTGALLGAWIGGTIGAGWPVQPEWRIVYSAPPR